MQIITQATDLERMGAVQYCGSENRLMHLPQPFSILQSSAEKSFFFG